MTRVLENCIHEYREAIGGLRGADAADPMKRFCAVFFYFVISAARATHAIGQRFACRYSLHASSSGNCSSNSVIDIW
jgi:hypothetical protein